MSKRRGFGPNATGAPAGSRRGRRARRIVIGGAVIAALGVFAGPAAGAAGPSVVSTSSVGVKLPTAGFPLQPLEPIGSYRLVRGVQVSADCQPVAPATTCQLRVTLIAAQLAKQGLPTRDRFTLATSLATLSPMQETATVYFSLAHPILNILYQYGDPRCYAIAAPLASSGQLQHHLAVRSQATVEIGKAQVAVPSA
jgi:hypothetical protein